MDTEKIISEWSKDEVKIHAIKNNSSILLAAVTHHENGECGWEEAMQVAAVMLAQQVQGLAAQLTDCVAKSTTPLMFVSQGARDCIQCNGTGYVSLNGHAGGRCGCTVDGIPVRTEE